MLKMNLMGKKSRCFQGIQRDKKKILYISQDIKYLKEQQMLV